MAKRLLIVAGIGVLLVGAGLFWLASSLDTLVARGIEHLGSEVLGAPVSVGSVELDLLEGRGSIRTLRVGNPEGFSAGDAMTFEELTVQVDPASVAETGDPLVSIPQIRLIGPRVRFEARPDGTSNLDQLRRNAEAYAPDRGTSESPAETEGGAPGVRLRIGSLELQEAAVSAAAGERERELSIPGFELKQLGGERGAPPADLAKQVASALTRQLVTRLARAQIEGAIGEQIDRALEDSPAGEAVRDALRSFGLPGGSQDDAR